ncbi:hypothetical protein KLQUMA228M_23755 [Klebsiella quasipneumoniae subsp. quasipneumoniae]
MSKARASPGFVVFAHPPGGAAPGRATWQVRSGSPGEALMPTPGMSAVPHAKKSPYLHTGSHLEYGGEGGLTRFARRYSAHPWASPLRGQRKRCSKTLPAFLSGQPARRLAVCPTGVASCRTPVGGSHPPRLVAHAKKKPVLAYELFLKYGGEGGIDSLRSPLRGSPLAGSRSVQLALPVVEPRSGVLIPPAGATCEKKARTCVRALLKIWR